MIRITYTFVLLKIVCMAMAKNTCKYIYSRKMSYRKFSLNKKILNRFPVQWFNYITDILKGFIEIEKF